ncbi:MAG: NADH-quinone oxidoreductase subunit L, partial [Acidobacteria bacterium]|nr:NADH-quinone oxidoreductase subunit L [Acidobacteriota bacterium]
EPHESPATMTGPLVILAVLSAVGGFINVPFKVGSVIAPALEHFLEPSFELAEQAHLPEPAVQWVLAIISVGVAVAGIVLARRRYVSQATPIESGGF